MQRFRKQDVKRKGYQLQQGGAMSNKKTTPERLAAFSDGVFAVIITIMVLDLKPPTETTLTALVPLWPTALSYAVSYFFIAIVWVNHHHLLRFTHSATPQLKWWNFAHLFMVSIVPATTVWMAAARFAAVTGASVSSPDQLDCISADARRRLHTSPAAGTSAAH
jgi:uncharacterized membrane protein